MPCVHSPPGSGWSASEQATRGHSASPSLLFLLLRPFPARERMARALYRAQRELQLRSLILGFRPKERSEFAAPFIVAGEPRPLDPNALPGARPARPRLPTAVTDGAVSVGWRGETQWGIWFHSERPVLLDRVAPTLMWASARCFFPLRHVTHPRESLGEGDDAYAVQVARQFVYANNGPSRAR